MNVESDELRLPDEFSYKMESPNELIAASALKTYLKTLNRKTVKQVLSNALADDPAYPQGHFADLIDSAISDAIEMIEGSLPSCGGKEAQEIRVKSINRLEVVDGKDVFKNMSTGFLNFVLDCYDALPD